MFRLNKFLVFSLILFIGLGVVCATGVDDASVDDATSSSVNEVVSETSMDNGNLLVGEDDGDNTDPGANPTPYDSIEERTYNNSIITLSGDQSFVDGVATFGSNVTLKSDDTTRTLSNFKIVINGNNVTINNVVFNHQTSTATKVIDVTGSASNVVINDTVITLTKNNDVTTMAINIDNNANNVVVNNSSITVNGAAQTLWHQNGDDWYDELMISGVNIDRASNVNIANSTVKMINTTDTVTSGTTMPAVTVKNTANNIIVANNTINSTGATYVYGVMCNDYVSSINISGNNVNVTGEIYTAGIDVSTTINSYVYENKILANTTNYHGFGYKQEALAYGIVLATYQTGNSNNNASYNNITLIANVGYGIENYLGSNNKIDYNNITIDAKRGLGIATNSSNGNYYRNNKINITCNPDAINVYDEAIPAQNVGIIVINGSSNTISDNQINITETNTDENPTSTAYAIILDENSEENNGSNNQLIVYLNNIIISSHLLKDEGSNSVAYTTITINSLNENKYKSVKMDEEIIIINDDNYLDYGEGSGTLLQLGISNGSYFITLRRIDINQIRVTGSNLNISVDVPNIKCLIFLSQNNINITSSNNPSVLLAVQRCTNVTVKDSTFLECASAGNTNFELVNTTIISQNDKTYIMSHTQGRIYGITKYYTSYFNTNTHMLLDSIPEGSTLIIWRMPGYDYTDQMVINKPMNIISLDNAIYDADITFVSGSEGSNITGLTLNGNLYINTSNIGVKNNTINKGLFVNEGSNVLIEENTFNTEETAIVLAGAIQNTIQNNNITTTSTYTITLDEDSAENTITNNNLQAAELTGVESILDNGEDNTISLGGDEPVIVEPVLKVDTTEFTVGEASNITASIYKADEVASDISGGKVVFKVNGVTLKDANGKVIYAKLLNGVATISDYVVPDSWNKENITISAVYSGSKSCEALRSEAVNMTVTKTSEPSLTVGNLSAGSGDTVTLTATVSDGNTPITTGKVVFKVNGKTVKDANGKVVYASVGVDGTVSVDYVIAESMKAKDYVITAVFTSSRYDRLTSNATLTVSS